MLQPLGRVAERNTDHIMMSEADHHRPVSAQYIGLTCLRAAAQRSARRAAEGVCVEFGSLEVFEHPGLVCDASSRRQAGLIISKGMEVPSERGRKSRVSFHARKKSF